jgi:rhomboid family GlyGly-CTERM serine protease
MRSLIRSILAPAKIPWAFLTVEIAAIVIQLHPGWRAALIYDRGAIANGEWWRIWTGHLVHFGWPHFIADAGLFIILGRLVEWEHPWLSRFALITMPAVISGTLYWLDPGMTRYAGFSAVNLGFLVFVACKGWQKNWVDWFWPAVLAIYVAEIILEATVGHGHGGGMIQFDDGSIQVATVAHIPGAIFGVLLAWCAREPAATRKACLVGTVFFALPAGARADGGAAAALTPPPKADAPPVTQTPPPSERAVSPYIAAELATTIPKYEPPPPVAAASAAPDPNVLRMSAYLVREPKLPTPEEVLTQKGIASIAMDRYLGPADALDRGVLNHFTLVQLWQKIPVLGAIPFVPFGSISNEARAMELYDQDRRLQEKADLMELVKLMKKTGDSAGGDKLKQEVDDSFR